MLLTGHSSQRPLSSLMASLFSTVSFGDHFSLVWKWPPKALSLRPQLLGGVGAGGGGDGQQLKVGPWWVSFRTLGHALKGTVGPIPSSSSQIPSYEVDGCCSSTFFCCDVDPGLKAALKTEPEERLSLSISIISDVGYNTEEL